MNRIMLAGLAPLLAFALAKNAKAAEPTGPTPINDPGTWVQSSDYPSDELRNRVTGTTSFRLSVSQTGEVLDCLVTISSGSTALDATACALIKVRTKFQPAKNAEGKPSIGTYRNRVRWVMPEIGPIAIPDAKSIVTVMIEINEKGIVESCEFNLEPKTYESRLDEVTPCTQFPSGRKLQEFFGKDGKPARVGMIMQQTVEYVQR